MEEGTFMTGVEILGNSPAINQVPESKPKVEEKAQMPPVYKTPSANKQIRSSTALTKSLQPSKNESFPLLQTRDATAKGGLRNSMTEANFKKPLFKKLATVRDFYEKTKSPNDFEKAKAASATKLTTNHWNTKREGKDPKGYTHADAFDLKIVQKYDDLYQSKKGFFDNGATENLAKRTHFFQEIEKQEVKVQGEQKRFNQISFEIQKREKLLAMLSTQEKELNKKLDDTTELEEKKSHKQSELTEWEEKIEVEECKNECLSHMKQLKKERLLTVKKNYTKQKEIFDTRMNEISQSNKETENIKALASKKDLFIKDLKKKRGMKDNLIDPEFEDLLENEMSEFEERRNLREIIKHERVLEEELRRQEEEEERRTVLAKENRHRDEENKRLQKQAGHEKELDEIKKQYHEFQKVTHVSKKDQLIEYFDGLEERSEVLEKEINGVNEDIRAKKEELKELRKQLKFKKFEETEKPKDNFPTDIRLDGLESILRDKQNDAGERENHIKRLDKLSYEVCTVVSRVLKQLQKSKTPMAVDKGNVVDLLSICGLKLERMLTVVIKKKKTFFIESINTDGTIKEGPPSYMNLLSDDVYNKSRKRYEKERPLEIGEEIEDSYLSAMREHVKNKDELEGLL